jgi:UDP-N-acetylmuramoylalanine--D-glutamate ligase
VPIPGMHNAENVMAATVAARIVGILNADIAAAVRTFKAVEHRLEFVRELGGVKFYNDSKATSVDATMKAIDSFEGNLWVILGGKDKGSDYSALRDRLRRKARGVLLVGSAAEKIALQLDGAAPLIPAGTLQNAVAHAWKDAAPGDTILLAPACASFDQFQSYEHRGRVFKDLVNGLEQHGAAA